MIFDCLHGLVGFLDVGNKERTGTLITDPQETQLAILQIAKSRGRRQHDLVA